MKEFYRVDTLQGCEVNRKKINWKLVSFSSKCINKNYEYKYFRILHRTFHTDTLGGLLGSTIRYTVMETMYEYENYEYIFSEYNINVITR